MIDCLGILTFTHPQKGVDFIRRIDYPVNKMVIINNSKNSHYFWADKCSQNKMIHRVEIHTQPNTGTSLGWNKIIKSSPLSEYWMIFNDDMVLGPGVLEQMVDETLKHTEGLTCAGTYHFGAMSLYSKTVEKVGLFDENIYPCYMEDWDYHWRMLCNGMDMYKIEGLDVQHPEVTTTFTDNPDWYLKNQKIQEQYILPYYLRKWGGVRFEEIYTTPWNSGQRDLWKFDLGMRKGIERILQEG